MFTNLQKKKSVKKYIDHVLPSSIWRPCYWWTYFCFIIYFFLQHRMFLFYLNVNHLLFFSPHTSAFVSSLKMKTGMNPQCKNAYFFFFLNFVLPATHLETAFLECRIFMFPFLHGSPFETILFRYENLIYIDCHSVLSLFE